MSNPIENKNISQQEEQILSKLQNNRISQSGRRTPHPNQRAPLSPRNTNNSLNQNSENLRSPQGDQASEIFHSSQNIHNTRNLRFQTRQNVTQLDSTNDVIGEIPSNVQTTTATTRLPFLNEILTYFSSGSIFATWDITRGFIIQQYGRSIIGRTFPIFGMIVVNQLVTLSNTLITKVYGTIMNRFNGLFSPKKRENQR